MGSAFSLFRTKNKLKILTKIQEQELNQQIQIPASLSKVTFKLANGETIKIYVDCALTGAELKKCIFHQISQTLSPKHMVLWIRGKRLLDNEIVGQNIFENDLIIQKKIGITQISKIQAFSKIEDEISLQKGVVKMSCGHLMGRKSLIALIQALINCQKYEITCPHEDCEELWDYSFCKKIGVFTKEEDKLFQKGLTNNWMELHTKKCPGCGNGVTNQNQNNFKVRCTANKCKFGYFCFQCLKPWNSEKDNDCGNVQCSFFHDFFLKIKTKKIKLITDIQENIYEQIDIPTHRLCPCCRIPIQHNQGCKHMHCQNCQNDFCWVCLGVFKKIWKCGNYNQFCGRVAPQQTFI